METAVQWLIDETMKLVVQYTQGTLNEDTLDDVIYEIGTKAKDMEKEQLKQLMWDLTEIDTTKSNKGLIIDNRFDTYWNETFKSE